MKITFWSSTEYSGFLERLVSELKDSSHEARQRFNISESTYRNSKGPLARLSLRIRQYIAYPIQLIFTIGVGRLRSKRFQSSDDWIVVSTNTFFAPLLATYLHPRVVHLVYDLFPEAMIHSGKGKENALRIRIIRAIVRKTFDRAQSSVFLGSRLRDYATSIHGSIRGEEIIPVGADHKLFQRGALTNAKDVSILYCGNFGRMHDVATLKNYFDTLSNDDTQFDEGAKGTSSRKLEFSFFCSGPKRPLIEDCVRRCPPNERVVLTLGGGLSQEDWIARMERSQIALVTMASGSESVVMPSKTYSAMMAGQAILAIAPRDSDLVDLVINADCGWHVEPGDTESLSRVISLIYNNPELVLEKRKNSQAYAYENYGQDVLAKTWVRLFECLSSKRC